MDRIDRDDQHSADRYATDKLATSDRYPMVDHARNKTTPLAIPGNEGGVYDRQALRDNKEGALGSGGGRHSGRDDRSLVSSKSDRYPPGIRLDNFFL